jgi:hypothetical protein
LGWLGAGWGLQWRPSGRSVPLAWPACTAALQQAKPLDPLQAPAVCDLQLQICHGRCPVQINMHRPDRAHGEAGADDGTQLAPCARAPAGATGGLGPVPGAPARRWRQWRRSWGRRGQHWSRKQRACAACRGQGPAAVRLMHAQPWALLSDCSLPRPLRGWAGWARRRRPRGRIGAGEDLAAFDDLDGCGRRQRELVGARPLMLRHQRIPPSSSAHPNKSHSMTWLRRRPWDHYRAANWPSEPPKPVAPAPSYQAPQRLFPRCSLQMEHRFKCELVPLCKRCVKGQRPRPASVLGRVAVVQGLACVWCASIFCNSDCFNAHYALCPGGGRQSTEEERAVTVRARCANPAQCAKCQPAVAQVSGDGRARWRGCSQF